jgi:phage tail tape-measure protein
VEDEERESIGKMVGMGIGAAGGAQLGARLIPIPLVGPFVGGVLGAAAGSEAGRRAGKVVLDTAEAALRSLLARGEQLAPGPERPKEIGPAGYV